MALCRPHFVAVLLCLTLTGCATEPAPAPLPQGPPFAGVETAPAGRARLYVFRPEFTELLGRERPLLRLDSEPQCLLGNGQYESFVLGVGEHVISLEPLNDESPTWKSRFTLTVAADAVYFLAAWILVDATAGRPLTIVPLGKSIGVVPASRGAPYSSGVQFEIVQRDEALPVISGMHRAVPATDAAMR